MSAKPDAVVLAGGRLHGEAARRTGEDVKAFVRVGGRTLIDIVVDALRESDAVARITIVGAIDRAQRWPKVDALIEASLDGSDNLMSAIRAAATERALICSSDLPYIRASAVVDFLARCEHATAAEYPIFTREEFLARFPGGRTAFAHLADGSWTGGSLILIRPAAIASRESILRTGFGARKSLMSLAAILGPGLTLKFVARLATIRDVERRASELLGGPVRAVRGADPALAMDCDSEHDFEYVRADA